MAVTYDGATDSDHTSELSPGGLFTHPSDVATIDISTVEGHLDDALNAAANSRGWAVGDTNLPLDGWSSTNNSEYYAEQSSSSATSAERSAASASGASTAATQSANAAAASATSAQGFASSAETSATSASDSATRAATSETNAANSATASAASATSANDAAGRAATSETNAANSATEADSDARAVENDLAEIRSLHEMIRADSEEIAILQQEISADSEEIAINLARAEQILLETRSDSEDAYYYSQRSRAFAEATGTEHGFGFSFDDTDEAANVLAAGDIGNPTGSSIQHVRMNFPQVDGRGSPYRQQGNLGGFTGGTQEITPLGTSYTIEVYKNWEYQGVFPFNSFFLAPGLPAFGIPDQRYAVFPTGSSIWRSTPAVGDILHVFVTSNDTDAYGNTDPAAHRSAYFQARRARYFADHSLELEERVDSEAAIVDSEFRAIEQIIAGIHGRIEELKDIGYGLTYDSDDSEISVDSDIIASRRYVDSEIAALVDNAPTMYATLRRIGEILDSDSDAIVRLMDYMDSDRIAREQLATDLMADIDSDASAIRVIGARIDSEQSALRADIDSDAAAIRLLQRVFMRDYNGLVPMPGAQDSTGERRYLADDGTWQIVQSGANVLPSDHVSITFNPTHQLEDQTPAVVTGTFSVNAPYTFVGTGTINGSNGTDTLTITDTQNLAVSYTHDLDSDTFTFTPPTGEDGNIRITATVTVDNAGTLSTVPVTANFEIAPVLFQTATGSNDSDITPANDPGNFFSTGIRFQSPETLTYTKQNRTYLLIALPREHSYRFQSGVVNLDVTQQGLDTTNNVQVYSIDDYEYLSQNETLTITITQI